MGSQRVGHNWATSLIWSDLQWTTFCQTSPPWPALLGWPHMAWLSFIELDKALVHVIRLTSFLWLCFVCLPSDASGNTYHLTWVSLSLVSFFFFFLEGCVPPVHLVVVFISVIIDISPGILIPACDSSNPAFHMMYSAYKLNEQGDTIQPWHTPFPILKHSYSNVAFWHYYVKIISLLW